MDKVGKKSPTIPDKEDEYEEEEEEEIEEDDNNKGNNNENEEDNEEGEMSLDEDEELVDEDMDGDIIEFDDVEDNFPVDAIDRIKTESIHNKSVQIAENLNKTNSIVKEESKQDYSGAKVMAESDTQANLKQLLNVDFSNTAREHVLDLLMKTELKPSSTINSKKRKPKQKYNVQSVYNLEKLQSETMTVNRNFKINLNESRENPELTTDFNTAIKKIKNKMLQEPEHPDQKVYKILFSDKEKNQNDAERLSSANTEYIANKVKGYLVQKQKNIDNITEALNEEMKLKCTFNPEILTNNLEYEQKDKRSLEEFLQDQNKHLEKVERKVEEFQKKREKEEQQIQDGARPKIDANSQKIYEEKIKTEDKPHERLYKQRFGNTKNDIVENSGKHMRSKTENILPKDIRKKGDKIEEFLFQKEKDKKPINKKEAEEHVRKLYESANDKKDKIEKLKLKVMNEECKSVAPGSYISNKFVLKNMMKKYKLIVNTIFALLVKQTGRNTLDYNSNNNEVEEDPIMNQVQLNRISLMQLNSVLQELGFVTENFNDDNLSSNAGSPRESMHKLEEKKLTCDLWEALKDTEGYVNVDHLFIFILAVVNLYEYYLYSSYKKSGVAVISSGEDGKKEMNKEKRDAQEKEGILSKISSDINSRIVSQGKYSAYDSEKNFLITFEKSKLIQKDFNLFYINFMNSTAIAKKKSIHVRLVTETNSGFKPNINRNSEKMSVEYRNKLVKELDNSREGVNSTMTGKAKIKSHTEYVNKLIMKKKKNQGLYAKAKEEILKNELSECTFKPKIIEDYPIKNDSMIPIDIQGKKMKVWEKLYKSGLQIISNKKDMSRDDMDVILNGKECSFRPNIEKPMIADEIKDNIYGESYEIHYNRLKNGRTERKVKESVHEKWEYPEEYYEYLNKNKLKNCFPAKLNEVNLNRNSIQNIPERNSFKDSSANNDPNAVPTSECDSEAVTAANLRGQNSSFEEEKKDAIPLLIIDVNIRPGVKKKIYVFDGDTAEALAERFSKEHSLDSETKSKLQLLIQSHMSRLLMRIDEENQSISEKSSVYNLS